MGDSRAKLLSHPLHPMLTHFPMALLSVSSLWDLIGLLTKHALWWKISFWCIVAGLIIGILTLITGLIDSMGIQKNGPEENTMNRHMYVMLAAFMVYLGDLFIQMGHIAPGSHRFIWAFVVSIGGFIILTIGGWYGGELVYRYHVGVSQHVSND